MSDSTTRSALAALMILAGCSSGGRLPDSGARLAQIAQDPRVLWTRDLGRAIQLAAEPIDGDLLVPVLGNRVLRLRPESGDVLWEKTLVGPPAGIVVTHGAVLLVVDFPEYGVIGVNRDTGEELWKTDLVRMRAGGSGDAAVLVDASGSVTCIDPASGDRRWRSTLAGAGFGDPQIGAGEARVYVPIRPDSLVALDLSTGDLLWSQGVGHGSRFAVDDGRILITNDDGALILLDEETGTVLGDETLTAAGAGAPMVSFNLIIGASVDGAVTAFDSVTLQPRWTTRLEPPLVSGPVEGPAGVLVNGSRGRLFRFASDGTAVEMFAHPERVIAPPVVSGSVVFLGGIGGRAVALQGGSS